MNTKFGEFSKKRVEIFALNNFGVGVIETKTIFYISVNSFKFVSINYNIIVIFFVVNFHIKM